MPTMAEKITLARADLRRLRDGWRPSAKDLVGAVELQDWLPVTHTEVGVPVLLGNAVNHPILGSRPIVTSAVLWLSEDRTIARTLSRWYKLGTCALPVTEPETPDPEVGL